MRATKTIALALGIACSLAAVACSSISNITSTITAPIHSKPTPPKLYTAKKPDDKGPSYQGMQIHTGQIVLTEPTDAMSLFYALLPEQYFMFTQAGVVSMEDGEPWVYAAQPNQMPVVMNPKPLDNIEGKVTRVKLMDYVAKNLYVEVLEAPPKLDVARMMAFCQEQYARKTPYDSHFRFGDHSRLFSTEFVELALRAGGAKPMAPVPSSKQPSLEITKEWLGISEDPLPAGLYYDPAQSVLSMGQFKNRTAAFAYFEAKREIFRRFQKPNQRVGYVFQVKNDGVIEPRPEIEQFLTGASRLFEFIPEPPPWGDERIARAVRKYADETFGTVN